MSRLIDSFLRCQDFQPLDHYFGLQMVRLSFPGAKWKMDGAQTALYLAAGLVCYEATRGNVCLNIMDHAGNEISALTPDGKMVSIRIPEPLEWLQTLKGMEVVGRPGDAKPLILDKGISSTRLYLNRYWQYEQSLADCIRARLRDLALDEILVQAGLTRLFPFDPEDDNCYQKKAVETAVKRKFSVITGGPGTGKTTTVLKLLALLIELAGENEIRIRLAAPTGKSAGRLQESIQAGKRKLLAQGLIDKKVHDRIQEEVLTLHRLLGTIKNSVFFRYNKEFPLLLDCLIVDEASMVDLAMMSKLAEALPPNARLVLLGDMDQLSSVEAGSVFGDICIGSNLSDSPLDKSIVKLQKSYRFEPDWGIGRLSNLVKGGEATEAWKFVHDSVDRQTKWIDLPAKNELKMKLRERLTTYYRQYLASVEIGEAFGELREFSILCGLRKGWYGAEKINSLIEEILVEAQLIPAGETWYVGRPVMITSNDYQLNLFNGDIGIVFQDEMDGQKKVFFETADRERFQKIIPGRLPVHEPAYAMTVHKSQGSEFGETLLLLPDIDSEVMTRELIYTGMTRARRKLEIWSSAHIFQQAIHKKCKRNSGLAEKLLIHYR